MPKIFELTFTKVADNLYSGYLSVEGRQMTFGVPKTKEEIYQFLFGGGASSASSAPEVQPQAIQTTESAEPIARQPDAGTLA